MNTEMPTKTETQHNNAIAIFEMDFKSIPSLLIAYITNSSFTHSAVRVDGVWYDSSENRGYFDKLDINEYNNRWCVIVELDGDLTQWLENMKGVRYNWKGIWQFPFQWFKNRNENHFYCFQTAWDACWYSLYKEHYSPPKVSGNTLKYFITEMFHTKFHYQKGLK